MCAPERTASRAKTSRVHTICAQYCRHDCCIHRWTHRLPSISSSPLAPKHTITRKIPSKPWGLLRHNAPTAAGYCCSYCYNTRGWDRLAQIIVNQGETRKCGDLYPGPRWRGPSCRDGLSPSLTFPPLAVPSPPVSLLALLSRSAMLAGPLLSRAGGARSMPPNPAQNVPPVADRVPPGQHSRDVNSCPREREGVYKPIPPTSRVATGHPGGYYCNYSGCPLLRDSGLPPRGGGGMCVCVYLLNCT